PSLRRPWVSSVPPNPRPLSRPPATGSPSSPCLAAVAVPLSPPPPSTPLPSPPHDSVAPHRRLRRRRHASHPRRRRNRHRPPTCDLSPQREAGSRRSSPFCGGGGPAEGWWRGEPHTPGLALAQTAQHD